MAAKKAAKKGAVKKKAGPKKKRALPAAVKKRVVVKRKVVSKRTSTKTATKTASAVRKRFAGLKLCFAGKPGVYGQARKTYEAWARSEGAKLVSNLDDSTDMLIVFDSGATAGAKKKAAALNAKSAAIHELSESEFLEMFRPTADEAVELLKSGEKGTKRLQTLVLQSGLANYQAHRSVDLSGADLRGCDLSDLNLNWAILDGADLREVKISATEFTEARNLRLEKASGHHLRFDSMSDCQCNNANLPNMFAGWNSSGGHRAIENCDFTNANLDNSYMNYGAVKSTSFKKAKLTNTDIHDAKLVDVDFTQADLTKANLSSSTCSGTVFKKARFPNADLQDVNFGDADLTGADFSNSMLVGADFSHATLGNAKFDGAVVVGANFAGADTSKTRGLTLPAARNAKAGKACRAIATAAKKANEITIEVPVTISEGSVNSQIHIAHGYSRFSFKLTLSDKSITKEPITYWCRMTSVAKTFERLGELWGHGDIDFGQLKVSTTKSDLKGKALKELVTKALSEVFDIAAPSEEDVKSQQKKAKQAKVDEKQAMADEIRGGKAGIRKFNSRKTGKVDYTEFDIRKQDFSGRTLTGIKASYANFQGSSFEKARIRQAKLECCKFQDCNFKNADLNGVNLTWCRFTNADLSGAKLSKCNFNDATMDKANFSGADLTGAKLIDGSVLGTNFGGAVVKDVQWRGCAFDEQTIFPDGFTVPEEMQFKGKGYDPRHVVDQAALSQVLDFDTFMVRIRGTVDQSRLAKSLKMLKADHFELFSEVDADSFVGVVKSQSDADLVYSCRLTSGGDFACCTQNLNPCGGLRGALCKHLLVLIVGLTKGDQIDPQKAATWADASNACKPELDKDLMSEVLLKYKGAEAGEVDWRPVETIPEDYYAF